MPASFLLLIEQTFFTGLCHYFCLVQQNLLAVAISILAEHGLAVLESVAYHLTMRRVKWYATLSNRLPQNHCHLANHELVSPFSLPTVSS